MIEINGYPGEYYIDTDAKVYSRKRGVLREMSTQVRQDGYCYVRLRKDGTYKHHYIHRLMYETFVGSIGEGLEVNHLDSDPTNNAIDNLEVTTGKGNISHAVTNGRFPRGDNHHKNKVKASMYSRMNLAAKLGITQQSIADKLGISQQAVSKILGAFA